LHAPNTRFLLDTNVFIAASKNGWTRTTDLVLRLVNGEEDLIANEALAGEYKKYAEDLGDYGQFLLDHLLQKVIILEISEAEIARCLAFFPEGQDADVLHAATCLSVGGVLISNDRHFEKIRQSGIIEIWTISDAIARLLEPIEVHKRSDKPL
jgi:predicted nucleic acid-binding protein